MDFETWLADANGQLSNLKQLTAELGLQFVDIPEHSMGVGFGVAFGQTEFSLVSVLAKNEGTAFITSGVLRDINKDDRLGALEQCNAVVSEGTGVPVFLHDADAGWDLIAQVSVPAQVLFDVPPYYESLLRGVAETSTELRPKFQEAGLRGEVYRWDNVDAARLLSRSLI